MGPGFNTSAVLLIAIGIAVTVFGLFPGVNFFTELPMLRGIIKKPLPRWFGRPVVCRLGSIVYQLGADPRLTVMVPASI
jgi:hypothetical protein